MPSWDSPATPGGYLHIGILLSQILISQDLGDGFDLPPCGKRRDRSVASSTQQLDLVPHIWCKPVFLHQKTLTGFYCHRSRLKGKQAQYVRMVTSAPTQLDPSNPLHSCMALPRGVIRDPSTCDDSSTCFSDATSGDMLSLCLLVCFPMTFVAGTRKVFLGPTTDGCSGVERGRWLESLNPGLNLMAPALLSGPGLCPLEFPSHLCQVAQDTPSLRLRGYSLKGDLEVLLTHTKASDPPMEVT